MFATIECCNIAQCCKIYYESIIHKCTFDIEIRKSQKSTKTRYIYHRGHLLYNTTQITVYRFNYQHVTMHSSHDKNKLNSRRQELVCLFVRVFQEDLDGFLMKCDIVIT
jgi:hypothetical protein